MQAQHVEELNRRMQTSNSPAQRVLQASVFGVGLFAVMLAGCGSPSKGAKSPAAHARLTTEARIHVRATVSARQTAAAKSRLATATKP